MFAILYHSGKEVLHDDTSEISAIGDRAVISTLEIEEAIDIRTIYIKGYSILTDQSALYPFRTSNSYVRWVQILLLGLKQGIAVSNHAHSGLPTKL